MWQPVLVKVTVDTLLDHKLLHAYTIDYAFQELRIQIPEPCCTTMTGHSVVLLHRYCNVDIVRYHSIAIWNATIYWSALWPTMWTLKCFRVVSEFAPPPEVKLKPGVLKHNDRTKPNVKDAGRGHGHSSAESNVDESQFVRLKSVFSEGPMTAQARVNNSHSYSGKVWNICW